MAGQGGAIRFSGLLGFDTDAIVQALVDIRREKFLKPVEDQKTTTRLRLELWNEIKSKLSSFQSVVNKIVKKTQVLPSKATSSDETILQASATASASTGTYNVIVKQLATATRVTTGHLGYSLGVGGRISTTTQLQSLKSYLAKTTSGNITINGKTISISTTDTLDDIINRINTSGAGVTASYDSTNDVLKLTSSNPIQLGSVSDTSNFLTTSGLLNSQQTFSGGTYTRQSTVHLGRMQADVALNNDNQRVSLSSTTGSFKINGVTISYNASTDSLNSIVSKINSNVSSVQAYYDPSTDKVVLVNRNTGSNAISVEDVTGNLMDVLGLLGSGSNSQASVSLGQDAKINIQGFNNDQDIVRSTNSISDVIQGVTLNLINADPTKTVVVTVGRDTTTFKDSIKDFVAKFNDFITLVNQRQAETPVKNPKTDAEKKIGLLRGDSTLLAIRSEMAKIATDRISGLTSGYSAFGEIGINLQRDGTLKIDEAKLDSKLSTDPDKVFTLLFNDSDNDGIVDDSETGVAASFKKKLDNTWLSTNLTSIGGYSVPKGTVSMKPSLLNFQMQDLDKRISAINEQIVRYEDLLRAKFRAAEQQLAYLQSRLGSSGLGSSGSGRNLLGGA